MSKRGDNIHKRKDGRWEGRYYKGRKSNGTIQYGSVYGTSYREVKKKLAEIISEPARLMITKSKEKTFGEVLMMWLEHNRIRLKGGTVNKYQNLIETQILPGLGGVKLSALTSTMINCFLMQKMQTGRLDHKGGLSASYVRSIMLVINATIKFAVEEQMCLPLKTAICRPIPDKKEISVLTMQEQKCLESYLMQELTPTKVGVLLALHTGLRIGEVCALAWDDVDLEEHVIRVRHTIARVKDINRASANATCLIIDTPKTKASVREIPIPSPLFPILAQIHDISSSRYVVSEESGFVSPRTFEYRYHRILKQCGIASYNFHAIRHTFATRCIEAGVDVKSLSEILGHANVGITLNTYVHSSLDMKRVQLEKLLTLSA